MRVILSLLSVETADTTLSHAAHDSKVEGNIIFTRLDAAINWMRKNSLWPMPMGLACCAIELMATGAAPLEGGPFVTSSGTDRFGGEPRAGGES